MVTHTWTSRSTLCRTTQPSDANIRKANAHLILPVIGGACACKNDPERLRRPCEDQRRVILACASSDYGCLCAFALGAGPAVVLHVNPAIQAKRDALGFKESSLLLVTAARRQ